MHTALIFFNIYFAFRAWLSLFGFNSEIKLLRSFQYYHFIVLIFHKILVYEHLSNTIYIILLFIISFILHSIYKFVYIKIIL